MGARFCLLGCLAIFALGGCGGSSDSDGRPRVDTGLPETKQLGELDDTEAGQACNATASALSAEFSAARQLEYFCTTLALVTTQTSTTCESQKNDCVQNPPDSFVAEDISFDCSTATASGLEGCQATVGELETCTEDLVIQTRTSLSIFNCSLAGDPEALEQAAMSVPEERPPTCQSISETCPTL
jgi:hypothetical protein